MFKVLIASLAMAFPLLSASADDLAFTANAVKLNPPKGFYIEEVPGVAFSPDGKQLYVFNRGRHSLLSFNLKGDFLDEIGAGLFQTPHGLRVDKDGNIWTTDTATHLVIKFTPDGQVLMVLGKKGTGSPGWFDRGYDKVFLNAPSDVAFDNEGNIYVADGGNFRVVKYSKDGDFIAHFGEKGSEPGQFNYPHTLLVDQMGRLLVADRENQRIQVFNLNGDYQSEWSGIGYPYTLVQDTSGTLWVTDARVDQLVKLSRDGKVLGRFGTQGKSLGKYGFLHGVAPHNGAIYVSDILNWKIERLVPVTGKN